MNEPQRMFDVPRDVVVGGVACTWCGARVGEECLPRDVPAGFAHAQRWRDFWNATCDRGDGVRVFAAQWLVLA